MVCLARPSLFVKDCSPMSYSIAQRSCWRVAAAAASSSSSVARHVASQATAFNVPPSASKSSPIGRPSSRNTGSSWNNLARGGVRYFSSAGGGGKRDFYEVLGIDRGADKATIKKAYFKLAKQYHPDTNKDDETAADKFKEATEAYEVLSDDKQKELYDNFGHAGVDPNFQANGGNPFGGGGFEGFEGFNFGDGSFHFNMNGGNAMDAEELFSEFFGGGRRRNRGPRRGSDLEMHVRIPFMEAVSGTSRDLNVRYNVVDRETGQYRVKERKITVDIPAGIDNGMNLRLAGKGAEGDPGAPPGNLLVRVIVDPHDYFVRDGEDIHTPISIDFVTAILGGTVDVRTLNGIVEMKIPRGCQPDTKMMLRGKGIREVHGSGKGNQIVHIEVKIPKTVTPYQEELLQKFNGEIKEEKAGDGLSGIGKVAENAFEKLFGKSDDDGKASQEASAKKENDDEFEDEDKKRAAS